jgi:hypothetical protein
MAPVNARQLIAGVGAALAGTALAHWQRSLPWSLAGIVGLAIGVLTISVLRTGERLRRLWRAERRRD